MRAVSLDFESAPRRIAWAGWGLLAIALALAGGLAARFVSLQAELELAESQATRLQVRARAAPADAKAARQRAEELQRARIVSRQLTLPWGPLFESVERAATSRVALLGLQPDTAQNVVRITAESRELSDALEFVRRLEATRRLGRVHLASHQVQEQDPQRPVRFVVIAVLDTERKS
jgi:hypothetical protein